jgi:hypothetical protein
LKRKRKEKKKKYPVCGVKAGYVRISNLPHPKGQIKPAKLTPSLYSRLFFFFFFWVASGRGGKGSRIEYNK